jgi:hypothetical protein
MLSKTFSVLLNVAYKPAVSEFKKCKGHCWETNRKFIILNHNSLAESGVPVNIIKQELKKNVLCRVHRRTRGILCS